MTCANCHDLKDQLAEMKRDLGYERDLRFRADICRAFHVGMQKASILALLYAAEDRVVHNTLVDDVIEEHGAVEATPNLRKILICQLRQRLGKDSIQNIYAHGYRLTPPGRAILDSAILRARRAA